MNDLETLKAMLVRAGIKFSEVANLKTGGFSISVERGYFGFVTDFDFNPDGSLLDMGAYE